MKNKSRYFKVGVTVFLTVCAILLFYDTLFGSRTIVLFFKTLHGALKPIIYGALIAYLLAPVINFFEKKLFPSYVERSAQKGEFCAKGPRTVSILITWIIIGVLFYLLLSVLLPELYKSLVQLFDNLEDYYDTISKWLNNVLTRNPTVQAWVTGKFARYYTEFMTLLSEKVLPQTQKIMTAVTGRIRTAIIFFKDFVVGIIVSIYLLATKERCAARSRKMIYALAKEHDIPWLFRGIHKADDIFSGFVRGKLLDSLIIGILCFIFSRIFRFPYAPLVSVIVGVTNVIPFFGPFLGAVPSLFLILLASPVKALYFLLFIIALQQVDGNIIGPKILGGSTGLSGLGVIVAILVGGSFFGIPGMFFGVPVFACICSLFSFLINSRLRARNLPTPSTRYRSDRPTDARVTEKKEKHD